MSESALLLGQLFNGLSVASILLLAALGLALSFGLMRVINMSHGEMLMLGGYLSFLVHQFAPAKIAFPLAFVVSFVGAGIFGALLEVSLIRRLHRRPLDTLLATWGVSLALQQGARGIFGPIGVEVTAPKWLANSISFKNGALKGLTFPFVRLFIIGLAGLVLLFLWILIRRTRIGLYLRAVHQDRQMAEALGVKSGRVDLIMFSVGTAIAGLAGAALALISPVTPTVGQSYIVYSFMVVILGGLGHLLGTLLAALVVGLVSAGIQIFTTVSFADVLLFSLVIAFIQFRPQGIIAIRGRALEEA